MTRRFIGCCALLVGVSAMTTTSQAVADTNPWCETRGKVNAALPSHVLVGLGSSSPDDTWAEQSGTRWDVQWVYLSGQAGNDWYNGFGGSPADGSWIDGFFQTIDGHGFIPGIHLYNVGFGHDTEATAGDILTEVQSASWTRQYFTEFKALMQHAKTFGKPVMVVLEGDSFGFLENLTGNNPNTAAAVASSGLPELAGLPNTIAGFGMAYLAIRKSVGASNVVMGPDTPYYAASGDIMNFPPADTDDLQPHVDYQMSFFGPFVGPNATGERFDFTASCPHSADCAAYTDGRSCWDPSDTASVDSPSIVRYAAWLRLFNQASGVRWVLHQVPIGNSQHRNVPFDGTPRSGYQDNIAEFLFQHEAPSSYAERNQHLALFSQAGVIALLFGFSDDGDTAPTDIWKDGQPFLSTHVAALNNASSKGGFPVYGEGSPLCAGSP